MRRSNVWRVGVVVLGLMGLGGGAHAGPATRPPRRPRITLNETDYRDRVLACWLGKTIGGTLGMPFEGKTDLNDLTFYSKVGSEPAANDDLDLQMLWLKAMEEHEGRLDAVGLAPYWLRYVPVDWNEYGVAKANLRMGLLPPLSGEFRNARWKHSNGAWIRSEIWACLYPGSPLRAAQMGWEDASVDHGAAEGTLAEVFTASLESAAFVERDRDRLIAFGLSMIPDESRVARAVRTAVEAKQAGKDWMAAREDVIRATEDLGWFQAPRNVAFTIIGWLYGDGEFGRSICTAVNCGDDTDCTGATLGSILGILGGTSAIPERWRKPIGDRIVSVAVSGFEIPKDLDALSDRTVAMAKKLNAGSRAGVAITAGPTDLTDAAHALAADPRALDRLWRRSPHQVRTEVGRVALTVDYGREPLVRSGERRPLRVSLRNRAPFESDVRLRLAGIPPEWTVTGVPAAPLTIGAGQVKTVTLSVFAERSRPGAARLVLSVTARGRTLSLPLALVQEPVEPAVPERD